MFTNNRMPLVGELGNSNVGVATRGFAPLTMVTVQSLDN